MATAPSYPCPNCQQPIVMPAQAGAGPQMCPHCRTPHQPPLLSDPNVASCPNCDQLFQGAGSLAGRVLTCPRCALVFKVPKASGSRFRRLAIQASLAGVITGVLIFGLLGYAASRKKAAEQAAAAAKSAADAPQSETIARLIPVEPLGCFMQDLPGSRKLLVVVMNVSAQRLITSPEDFERVSKGWDKSRRDPSPQGPEWLRITDPTRFSLTTADNAPRLGEFTVFRYDSDANVVTVPNQFYETRGSVQFDAHEIVLRAIGWTIAADALPPFRVQLDDDKPQFAPLKVVPAPQYPFTLDLKPEKLPSLPQPVLPDRK